MNCLRSGHFLKNCCSKQRCKECHKTHHSLFHIATPPKRETKPLKAKSPLKDKSTVVSKHVSQLKNCHQVFLMTCHVKTVGPDSSTTQARALLDSALSASFIMERLAQCLRPACCNHNISINGFGATSNQ